MQVALFVRAKEGPSAWVFQGFRNGFNGMDEHLLALEKIYGPDGYRVMPLPEERSPFAEICRRDGEHIVERIYVSYEVKGRPARSFTIESDEVLYGEDRLGILDGEFEKLDRKNWQDIADPDPR
jgi:hypothetical protein